MNYFFQIRMRKYRFDFGDGSELEVAGLDNCFNVFVKGEIQIEYDSQVSSSGFNVTGEWTKAICNEAGVCVWGTEQDFV